MSFDGIIGRRQFLAAGAAALALSPGPTQRSRSVHLLLRPERVLGTTPQSFLGLGFETASVAYPGILSDTNQALINYVRAIGGKGVIRIGGNTSDYAKWRPFAKAVSLPQPRSSVINQAVLEDLGRFLDAIGWKLIWGLNLGTGTPQMAAEEAAAVNRATRGALLALQIGNEPDLYSRNGMRTRSYAYADYQREFQRYAKAVRGSVPAVPLAGPDVAAQTSWTAAFARGPEHPVLLTQHYYAEGPPSSPASTIGNLLKPNIRFEAMSRKLHQISISAHIPYRIVETNSCFGGGKPGVSDSFASALWGLNYCFSLAGGGSAGLNFENGINQFGRVSCYSPIYRDDRGGYSARPLYYAMRAFSLAGVGERLALESDSVAPDLDAYAVRKGPGIWVTLINKSAVRAAEVAIACSQRVGLAAAIRLMAPSLESTGDVTLGGAAISNDAGREGDWKPSERERLHVDGGNLRLQVPAASATIVEIG